MDFLEKLDDKVLEKINEIKEEIKREFKKNEYTAFHDVKSLRWRLGYLMIKIGCYPIAHKLIRY